MTRLSSFVIHRARDVQKNFWINYTRLDHNESYSTLSCDVATQARDVKGIVAAGYEITSVQPFDLFPQTRHIECLIVLEKK